MQAQGARVVTPEAVVLDVRTAGLGSRALARALDAMIQGAALTALLLVTGFVAASAGGSLGTAGLVVDLILVTVILFGYPVAWESLWRGRTPGKAALGLRVVTRQGAPIRFRHALVRGLLGIAEIMVLPVIGVISMLASATDQRLGDMAAGTLVVRERAPARMSVPVIFHPPVGLESFVASLDVSAMTAGEYENVRSFLIRAHEMAPLPRSNLAARLAGPLVTRWHQPVPPGTGPELWLACVACAYQRRHGAPFAAPRPSPSTWAPPHPATRLAPPPPPPPGPAVPAVPAAWSPPPGPAVPAVRPAWGPPATPPVPAATNDGFAPPD